MMRSYTIFCRVYTQGAKYNKEIKVLAKDNIEAERTAKYKIHRMFDNVRHAVLVEGII